MEFYSILEVEKTATKDEIKKSYRKLAMKFHPDRNSGDKEAEKKFKEINEAYGTLSDDKKRQQYDMFGKSGGAGGNPFGGGGGFGGGVEFDVGDIFESFFGGQGGGFGGGTRRQTSQKGEDLEYPIHIDLKTSIYGGKEKIIFEKQESCKSCKGEGGENKVTCKKCEGRGRYTKTSQSMFGMIQQTVTCDDCMGSGESFEKICDICRGTKRENIKKEIELEIPAGIDDGMIIKMTGEGNSGIGTSAKGDLYIKFRVSLEEKGLKRDGNNLSYDLEIEVVEAVLGTTKEINFPIIGKRKVEIPAGSEHGSVIKVKGDGVVDVNGVNKGDLYIELNLKIPKKLGKIERELFEKIAAERKINVNNKKGVLEKLFS